MNPYFMSYIAQRQQPSGQGFTSQLPGGNQAPSGGILYVPGMGYMTLMPGTTVFLPGIGYMTFTPTLTANMINQIGAGTGAGMPGGGTGAGTSPLGGGTGTSPLGRVPKSSR